MPHPEWVLQHKRPNTEIRCIRGRYYLYNRTSVWSPEKKRPKKITGKQIGVIDEVYGLIPTGMSRRGKIPNGVSKIKEDAPSETNFMDKFESMEDKRSERNRLYSVAEILLVTFLGVICGAEGWQDVESYGKAKIEYLRKYFSYKNGIPSDDTIRRFFRSLDPDHFKAMFHEWAKSLAQTVGATVIAIDGKSSRRSHDTDRKMLHTVTAFATDARIVLGQEKVSDKSNEITAIPLLLEMLDIKGHIITIDAMGCQYSIANQILRKEADYMFSLKGNQESLARDVELYFNDPVHQNTLKHVEDYDKGHGRLETRQCYVCSDVSWLRDMHPNWRSVHSIVKVTAKRETKGKPIAEDTRYFISSLTNPTPENALKAIRSHWAIENSLHWILDMSFNEDYSRIRKDNAPFAMAIIRHFALNLLQQHKPERQSIKRFRKICSWSDQELTALINKHTSCT